MAKVTIVLEDKDADVAIRVETDPPMKVGVPVTPALYLGAELMARLRQLHEEQPTVDAETVAPETSAPATPEPAPDANNG